MCCFLCAIFYNHLFATTITSPTTTTTIITNHYHYRHQTTIRKLPKKKTIRLPVRAASERTDQYLRHSLSLLFGRIWRCSHIVGYFCPFTYVHYAQPSVNQPWAHHGRHGNPMVTQRSGPTPPTIAYGELFSVESASKTYNTLLYLCSIYLSIYFSTVNDEAAGTRRRFPPLLFSIRGNFNMKVNFPFDLPPP